jgi:hypothetical protein
MIVLIEPAHKVEPSASVKHIKSLTGSSTLGYKVYYIPPNFERYGTAESALWHIPKHPKETIGI